LRLAVKSWLHTRHRGRIRVLSLDKLDIFVNVTILSLSVGAFSRDVHDLQ